MTPNLVLDRDIMKVAPQGVIATNIKLTVLNGEIGYHLP